MKIPIRTELTVLSADDPSDRKIGFVINEKIGTARVNPRGISRMSMSSSFIIASLNIGLDMSLSAQYVHSSDIVKIFVSLSPSRFSRLVGVYDGTFDFKAPVEHATIDGPIPIKGLKMAIVQAMDLESMEEAATWTVSDEVKVATMDSELMTEATTWTVSDEALQDFLNEVKRQYEVCSVMVR